MSWGQTYYKRPQLSPLRVADLFCIIELVGNGAEMTCHMTDSRPQLSQSRACLKFSILTSSLTSSGVRPISRQDAIKRRIRSLSHMT